MYLDVTPVALLDIDTKMPLMLAVKWDSLRPIPATIQVIRQTIKTGFKKTLESAVRKHNFVTVIC